MPFPVEHVIPDIGEDPHTGLNCSHLPSLRIPPLGSFADDRPPPVVPDEGPPQASDAGSPGSGQAAMEHGPIRPSMDTSPNTSRSMKRVPILLPPHVTNPNGDPVSPGVQYAMNHGFGLEGEAAMPLLLQRTGSMGGGSSLPATPVLRDMDSYGSSAGEEHPLFDVPQLQRNLDGMPLMVVPLGQVPEADAPPPVQQWLSRHGLETQGHLEAAAGQTSTLGIAPSDGHQNQDQAGTPGSNEASQCAPWDNGEALRGALVVTGRARQPSEPVISRLERQLSGSKEVSPRSPRGGATLDSWGDPREGANGYSDHHAHSYGEGAHGSPREPRTSGDATGPSRSGARKAAMHALARLTPSFTSRGRRRSSSEVSFLPESARQSGDGSSLSENQSANPSTANTSLWSTAKTSGPTSDVTNGRNTSSMGSNQTLAGLRRTRLANLAEETGTAVGPRMNRSQSMVVRPSGLAGLSGLDHGSPTQRSSMSHLALPVLPPSSLNRDLRKHAAPKARSRMALLLWHRALRRTKAVNLLWGILVRNRMERMHRFTLTFYNSPDLEWRYRDLRMNSMMGNLLKLVIVAAFLVVMHTLGMILMPPTSLGDGKFWWPLTALLLLLVGGVTYGVKLLQARVAVQAVRVHYTIIQAVPVLLTAVLGVVVMLQRSLYTPVFLPLEADIALALLIVTFSHHMISQTAARILVIVAGFVALNLSAILHKGLLERPARYIAPEDKNHDESPPFGFGDLAHAIFLNTILALYSLTLLGAGYSREWDDRRSFILTNQVSASKIRSEALLENMLPRSILRALEGGRTLISEEFEEVSIMFIYIDGFNAYTAFAPPKKLITFLNDVFSAIDRLCELRNVYKIETVGDVYMVGGGVPDPCDDHAERVGLLALDLMKLEAGWEMSDRTANLPLRLRIGVHCGPIVAGVIGLKRLHYRVFGDTVNVASRMGSHGAVGKVQCSEVFQEALVREGFVFEHRGEIMVKGKGMQNTYFLLSGPPGWDSTAVMGRTSQGRTAMDGKYFGKASPHAHLATTLMRRHTGNLDELHKSSIPADDGAEKGLSGGSTLASIAEQAAHSSRPDGGQWLWKRWAIEMDMVLKARFAPGGGQGGQGAPGGPAVDSHSLHSDTSSGGLESGGRVSLEEVKYGSLQLAANPVIAALQEDSGPRRRTLSADFVEQMRLEGRERENRTGARPHGGGSEGGDESPPSGPPRKEGADRTSDPATPGAGGQVPIRAVKRKLRKTRLKVLRSVAVAPGNIMALRNEEVEAMCAASLSPWRGPTGFRGIFEGGAPPPNSRRRMSAGSSGMMRSPDGSGRGSSRIDLLLGGRKKTSTSNKHQEEDASVVKQAKPTGMRRSPSWNAAPPDSVATVVHPHGGATAHMSLNASRSPSRGWWEHWGKGSGMNSSGRDAGLRQMAALRSSVELERLAKSASPDAQEESGKLALDAGLLSYEHLASPVTERGRGGGRTRGRPALDANVLTCDASERLTSSSRFVAIPVSRASALGGQDARVGIEEDSRPALGAIHDVDGEDLGRGSSPSQPHFLSASKLTVPGRPSLGERPASPATSAWWNLQSHWQYPVYQMGNAGNARSSASHSALDPDGELTGNGRSISLHGLEGEAGNRGNRESRSRRSSVSKPPLMANSITGEEEEEEEEEEGHYRGTKLSELPLGSYLEGQARGSLDGDDSSSAGWDDFSDTREDQFDPFDSEDVMLTAEQRDMRQVSLMRPFTLTFWMHPLWERRYCRETILASIKKIRLVYSAVLFLLLTYSALDMRDDRDIHYIYWSYLLRLSYGLLVAMGLFLIKPTAISLFETFTVASAIGGIVLLGTSYQATGRSPVSEAAACTIMLGLPIIMLVLGLRFMTAAAVGFLIIVMYCVQVIVEFKALDGNEDLLKRGSVSSLCIYMLMQYSLLVSSSHSTELERRRKFLCDEEIRQQKAFTNRILCNLMPPTVATSLRRGERHIVDNYSEASVLYADIVGFTPLSAMLGPLKLVVFLNRLFSDFDVMCDKHSVTKINTIGDCYTCMAGVPLPDPDHCMAVVEMGLSMLLALDALQEELTAVFEGLPHVDMRVGVHTGSVIAGVVGIKNLRYDVWGETVTMANKMESSGLPGRIHLSRASYEQVKETYTIERAPDGTDTFFLVV
eukprot:jgi/Mesvir1/25524/Mv01774-RA.1